MTRKFINDVFNTKENFEVTLFVNEIRELLSRQRQKDKEKLLGEFQERGFCQGCGFRIDLCNEKPCRVRKILLDCFD